MGTSLETQLFDKTERYEQLLTDALAGSSISTTISRERQSLAREHLEMAEAYLQDGQHFCNSDDVVTALAAFSYGHGWLDAAIRSGLVEQDLSTTTRGPRDV